MDNLKKRFSKENMHREFKEVIRDITKKDLFMLLLLPIIATIIELLPVDFQNVLKLNVQNPSWWQFLTSAFTHQSFKHYYGNIISFLIIAVVELLIVSKINMKRRYFYLLSATYVMFPIISSAYQVLYYPKLFPNMQVSCGASGIIAAMIGFMPMILMGYFSKEKGVKMVNLTLLLMSTFYTGIMLLITYAFLSSIAQISILSTLILVLAYHYRNNFRYVIKAISDISRNFFLYLLLFLLALLFITIPLALFPLVIRLENGSGVNVIVHYIGVIFGIYLSYLFFSNLGVEKQPFSYHFKPKTGRFLDRFRQ
jgi:membrane associated rhomboid family serine protease